MNDKVITVLESLLAKSADGKLHARDVVDTARDEDSPLHDFFDWNDSTAAESYRIWQARVMICRIRITKDPASADPRPVRVFINLMPDRHEGGGYRLLDSVLSDEEQRNALIRTAIMEISAWRARYAELTELATPVWTAAMRVAEEKKITLPFLPRVSARCD